MTGEHVLLLYSENNSLIAYKIFNVIMFARIYALDVFWSNL